MRQCLGRSTSVLVFVILPASCGGGSTTTPSTATVSSVVFTPAIDSIVPGQTVQLSASPKDANGAAVSDATISWSVTPSTVATISNSGMVTAVGTGTATVTALIDGKSATSAITVTDGAILGAAGATLTGMVTLVLPPNALSTPTPVSIRPMFMPPPSAGMVAATAVDFGPTGTQFAQPVTINLHYTAAELPAGIDPSQLRLFLRDGNRWTLVPGSSVDTASRIVTGATTHFSGYVACVTTCLGGTPSIYINAFDSAAVAPGSSFTWNGQAGVIPPA